MTSPKTLLQTSRSAMTRLFCMTSIAIILTEAATAQNYTVNSAADTHATSPTTSPLDGSSLITLRSAMEAATQIAGTHVITIPSGITVINLSLGQITAGSASLGNNITVNGPGKSILTINQTTLARVFITGTGAIAFSLNDLTINYSGPVGTIGGGGGAIQAGGVNAATSLTNVAINNFNIQVGNGGALSCSISGSHTLALNGCDFNNNYTGGVAGAVSYNGNGTCTIANCNFNNNQTGPNGANTGGAGGALSTTGTGNGGTYTVTNCNFTGNKVLAASAQGGAVINTNGALTISFCRFVNNTAATATNGNVLAQTGGASVQTINANNNWWGDNAPDATTDYVVLAAGGSITVSKWLQLKTTAASNPLCAPAATTVTASFLTNSANETLTTGNISKLIGLPVTFINATLGSLSGAQTSIQANGTATVTFTPGATAGAGGVDAKVDNLQNGDARASITINIGSAITSQPTATTTTCAGNTITLTVGISGGSPSYQWRKGTTNLSNGNTGSGSSISGATSATLTISNAAASDAATDYNVVVTPSCGSAQTSNSVQVIINTPPTITTSPVATSVCTGQTTTLTVAASANPSVPITAWQWQKGTINISDGATGNGGTYSGTNTSTLTLSGAASGDAGSYRAFVTNGCGNTFSSGATLTVSPVTIAGTTITGSGTISASSNSIYDGACHILGTLVPTGTSTALSGNVSSKVTIDPGTPTLPSGAYLVNRNYDITPTTNAATATANVTLYFLQSEFTQFNSIAGVTQFLPASTTDPQHYRNNIRVVQYHGTGTAPGNYTGARVNIVPTSTSYNTTYGAWEVSFPVNGFSGFYLTNATGIALPVQLVSFSGSSRGPVNVLNWKTAGEVNAGQFIIERSDDAASFEAIGTIMANGKEAGHAYTYTDEALNRSTYYYRLRMNDRNGDYSYSGTVVLTNNTGTATASVGPVPFGNELTVNVRSTAADVVTLLLSDAQGSAVDRYQANIEAGSNVIIWNRLGGVPPGVYFLTIKTGVFNKVVKVLK